MVNVVSSLLCAPCLQLAPPVLLTAYNDFMSPVRSSWVQIDVSSAGWPLLKCNTYYWIVVTPGTPLSLPNRQYNGVLWTGIDVGLLPPFLANDADLFTGRQLMSQRFARDFIFGANTTVALRLATNTSNWAEVDAAPTRLTNWRASGSRVRYGVSVIGWQVTPSSTPTSSSECNCVMSVFRFPLQHNHC
jgi:hypothetical protein